MTPQETGRGMLKQFEFEGDVWEAEATGTSVDVSSGYPPGEPRHWGVTFRCVSSPRADEYKGDISKPNPNAIREDELRAALREAMRGRS